MHMHKSHNFMRVDVSLPPGIMRDRALAEMPIVKASADTMSCFAQTAYLKGSLASSRNTSPEAEPSESHYFPNTPLNIVILVVRIQLLSSGEHKCNRVENGIGEVS